MKTCLDCPSSLIINDRDPDDWFCDDDKAIVCSSVKNLEQDITSKYLANRSPCRIITCACRPYNLKKEATIPYWCPKNIDEKYGTI